MDQHEQAGEQDDTVTRTLAEQLDLTVHEFIEVFGAGWQTLPNAEHDLDADPSGEGYIFGPWFSAGKPFQLLLRIRPDIKAGARALLDDLDVATGGDEPRGEGVPQVRGTGSPREPRHSLAVGPHGSLHAPTASRVGRDRPSCSYVRTGNRGPGT